MFSICNAHMGGLGSIMCYIYCYRTIELHYRMVGWVQKVSNLALHNSRMIPKSTQLGGLSLKM